MHRALALASRRAVRSLARVWLQRRNKAALETIRTTFDRLIARSKAVWETEDEKFIEEEFLSRRDPSILHFLIASGDDITSKQLRDDLMTMLIAGHETTAAVLTWTTYLLTQHPEEQAKVQAEVRPRPLAARGAFFWVIGIVFYGV